MNIIKTDIPEVLIFEPRVFGDARGFFFESFSSKVFNEAKTESMVTPVFATPILTTSWLA